MRNSIRGRVLEDIRRYGNPILPLPDGPSWTEAYSREYERLRVLTATRLDEAADRLCLPVQYLVTVLADLEDHDVIDWRTGVLREGATA